MKRYWIIITIVILLVIAGLAAYFLLSRTPAVAPPPSTTGVSPSTGGGQPQGPAQNLPNETTSQPYSDSDLQQLQQYLEQNHFPTSTSQLPPQGPTFSIQTPRGIVQVNNFYASASDATSTIVTVTSTDEYNIIYHQENSSFLITLVNRPITTARTDAENAFLQVLGISKSDACRLYVAVGIPAWVDPDHGGEVGPLSFCATQ